MEQKYLDAYLRYREELVRRARWVARRAYSYRGFNVGCAVLAWRPAGISLTEKYKVFTAANVKPLPHIPKQCAETTAVCYARSNGYTKIVAIVVVGEPQQDADSGVSSITLHPCSHCRTLLAALPEVSLDTIVLTVHNHSGAVEEQALQGILSLHHHHQNDDSVL